MPAETTTLFWLMWIATVGLALWMLYRSYADPNELYGIYPISAAGWLYFFGLMSFKSVQSLGEFLSPEMTQLGQLIAFLCLGGLVLGWRWGGARERNRLRNVSSHRNPSFVYDYQRLWFVGFSLIVIGSIAFQSFVASGGQFATTSAYWYMSGNLIYPGSAIAIIAIAKDPTLRRAPYLQLVIGFLSVAVLPQLLSARRGPTFVLIIVLLISPAISGWIRPKPITVFLVLGLVGAAMIFMVLARQWVYHSDSLYSGWKEAANNITIDSLVSERAGTIDDNEFAYHCGTVYTASELGLYHYGTGDLSLLLHWVPRDMWPEKPELGRGWLPRVEDELPGVTGWTMVVGGAIGGVSSSFHQYGWGAPVFWFTLGAIFSKLYTRATLGNNPLLQASWVGILASMHWLIAQSFHDAFIPLCIYLMAPQLAFRFARTSSLNRPWNPALGSHCSPGNTPSRP